MSYLLLAARDCAPFTDDTPFGWWANEYNKDLILRNAARYLYYKGGIPFDCFVFPYVDRLSLFPGREGAAPGTGCFGGTMCVFLPEHRLEWALGAIASLPQMCVTACVSEARPTPDAIPLTLDLLPLSCDKELCLRDAFGDPAKSCFAPEKPLELRPGVPIGRYRLSPPSPLALPDSRDSSVRLAHRKFTSVCETAARIARQNGALVVRDRCESFSLLVPESAASALLDRLNAFCPLAIEREKLYML